MVVVGVAVLAGAAVIAQGTTPGAPGSLTFQVSGGSVWLNWISSTGMADSFNPNVELLPARGRAAAGAPPFFTWDSASLGG